MALITHMQRLFRAPLTAPALAADQARRAYATGLTQAMLLVVVCQTGYPASGSA